MRLNSEKSIYLNYIT